MKFERALFEGAGRCLQGVAPRNSTGRADRKSDGEDWSTACSTCAPSIVPAGTDASCGEVYCVPSLSLVIALFTHLSALDKRPGLSTSKG